MDKREFLQWFGEQVQTRWPRWEVNGPILSDWFTALGRYDVTTLTEAVRRHKIRHDLARPRISKVVFLVRELHSAALERAPKDEMTRDFVTARQFWEKVRTTFPRQKRMALMRQQVKFDPRAAQRDPEAYAWVM
ncbi:MAG: hypothetical protein GY851_10740, partial [bacterium]|nr:hypothetical protein [bacterium]